MTMKTLKCRLFSTAILITICVVTVSAKRCNNCFGGICNAKGECMYGCKAGFTDKHCSHKCQSTCIQSVCELKKDSGKIICSFGCIDGYCGQQCKAPCPEDCPVCDSNTCSCPRCNGSSYGDNCEHSCINTCLGFACDNKGQCLIYCKDGWYGAQCNHQCRDDCERCNKDTGKCVKYRSGIKGDPGNEQDATCQELRYTLERLSSSVNAITVINVLIAMMLLMICVYFGAHVWLAWRRARKEAAMAKQLPMDARNFIDDMTEKWNTTMDKLLANLQEEQNECTHAESREADILKLD